MSAGVWRVLQQHGARDAARRAEEAGERRPGRRGGGLPRGVRSGRQLRIQVLCMNTHRVITFRGTKPCRLL